MSTKITVNGTLQELHSAATSPLLYVLRNELKLNGAKFGCGMGQCGVCTVMVDGHPVFSCLTPLAALAGRQVRTIESLGTAASPGPLQAAFIKHQAAQCGYCIAGMIMRAQALLEKIPSPSDEQILEHMEPNLCRCGTHMRIFAAIKEVARTGLRTPAAKGVKS